MGKVLIIITMGTSNGVRKISFGENGNLWLEKVLAKLRFNKIIGELKTIKPLEKIVDFGSGFNGELLIEIIKLFPDIKNALGVDLSVRENTVNPKIKLIAVDLNHALPISSGSFDVAVSTAVIEHLGDSSFTINEIYRVLKTGGSFLLTTPPPRAKKILEFLSLKLNWLDKTEIVDHENYFTPVELKNMLSGAGFKNIEIKTFQFGCNILASCKK